MTIAKRPTQQKIRRRQNTLRQARLSRLETLERRELLAAEIWQPLGPFSATDGQVENASPNDQIVGSIHTVLAHPTDANTLFVGASNGGVWKTTDASSTQPSWTPLTDDLPSNSIGAMIFDRADASFQTLYVGTGRYSSFARLGGDRIGLLKTDDGGTTWTVLDGGGILRGKNISGVYANGSTVVVSVSTADSFGASNVGIFRSTDGGLNFAQVSLGDGSTTGLPAGTSYDLFADPTNADVLYTATVFSTSFGSGQVGVYKSVDQGASWAKVSDGTMDALIDDGTPANPTGTSNIEITVGNANNVYVAIINGGNLAGLFRSGNGGASWTAMDTPSTNENGTDVGLNPKGGKGPVPGSTPAELAGGQGTIHFSMVADPVNPFVIYAGGDRQPGLNEFNPNGGSFFPNSIGANDFSGRLFRGDASQPAGSQWVHLTHSDSLGAVGGGTANGSAPHADSREIVFDASGNLIEVDDGGVYRRTSPQDNTGDWFSLTGSLQTTEVHDIAYDSLSNIVITGNQDTGTTQQPFEGATLWESVATADGGDVVVDTVSLAGAGQSQRYSSFQNLGAFRKRVYDATGAFVSESFPAKQVISGAPFVPAFVTPLELNSVDPDRLIIQGRNATYETFDQGETLSEIPVAGGGSSSVSFGQNAVLAGGVRGGVPDADLLWVGAGNELLFRDSVAGPLTPVSLNPPVGRIVDLAANPADWDSVVVADRSGVAFSEDAGASWTDISGDLFSQVTSVWSLEYINGAILDAVLVGTNLGVFATAVGLFGSWTKLSEGIPNTVSYDLEYDATDNVLVSGTLGRGAWMLNNASDAAAQALAPDPPNLLAIRPDANELLVAGDTLHVAPREFNLLFDGNANLDETTINTDTVKLIRSGGDNIFGNGNDVEVALGYVGLVEPGSTNSDELRQVVIRPASTAVWNANDSRVSLPDDAYQVLIVGSGASPLTNSIGLPFNEGTDSTTHFFLDRGAQVVAVDPQPITRDAGGNLVQASDEVVVYFDDQELDASAAINPSIYRLVNTQSTLSVSDDVTLLPLTVVYDPAENKAVLTFASDLTAGNYRLDIGDSGSTAITINNPVVINDNNSSFVSATDLGVLGGIGTTVDVHLDSQIEAQSVTLPPRPGAEDEPGHRQIQRESHLLASQSSPVHYFFPDELGTDTSGNPYINLITETEKQITREIIEIYAEKSGYEFIEVEGTGTLMIGKGDMRSVDETLAPGTVAGLASPAFAVLDGSIFNQANRFFGDPFSEVMFHEIGHSLGLGHSYDLPSVQGSPAASGKQPLPNDVLPGDHDLLHLQHLVPSNSTDIDLFQFELTVPGQFTAETIAERLGTPSFLDSALMLYRLDGGAYELVARNDQYFGADSFLDLKLDPGIYFVGVSSTGNTAYDPNIDDSGFGGSSEGAYRLSLSFAADQTGQLVDLQGTTLDGDADGSPGGVYSFWFQGSDTTNTIYVDKANDTTVNVDGTGAIGDPYDTISAAFSSASAGTIVRIVGNGGADGDVETLDDNLPYLIGLDSSGNPLSDGADFLVPQGVNVMIQSGTLIKLRKANLDAGTSSAGISRAASSIQVLGTPEHSVFLRSYNDDSVGGNSNGTGESLGSGDFGGIVFREDSDLEELGIFLNYVNHADISHGGGKVFVDAIESVYTPIHITTARPTLAFNKIALSDNAAISANPDSFDESGHRIGPDIYGNFLDNNTIDGLFIRVNTPLGSTIEKLNVSGRFDDTDITHVLSENLIINGAAGGLLEIAGARVARPAARLAIDPGVVLKLNNARIEAERGAGTLIAEGTLNRPIIFTSISDGRYGGSGSFDTDNSTISTPQPGDWGGLFFGQSTTGNIDNALIAYGGGVTPIEGGAAAFNAIEVHQADLRLTNTLLRHNAEAGSTDVRNGRGASASATIYVRGAQPTIVANSLIDNGGSAISINANALRFEGRRDPGRSTGTHQRFAQFDDNHGPLVRLNRLENNDINGIEVRGELLTTESIWDDTDIVHVLRSEVTVDNLHTYGGLTLQSSNSESLVVKLDGSGAGFTATGTPVEIVDRIGGTIHILGTVGHPVVLTGLSDDSVGAGFTPGGESNVNTDNSANPSTGTPGAWRGLLFDEFSNDRNVAVHRELENPLTAGVEINSDPATAQNLGALVPDQKNGDENRRVGFEVTGFISPDNSGDVDVYSFAGTAGTPVWIDIDNTDTALDAVLELIDSNGVVLARSVRSSAPGTLGSFNDATLEQNPYLGRDHYTQNFRDPGLFYTLPGLLGETANYFVRVSSSSSTSHGEYQLQIRLDQVQEFPGSTVQFADIRYAQTGIDVRGLPAHSPLIGEAGEINDAGDTFATAQELVNLLETDRAALSIAGLLDVDTDVDWYSFDLEQTGVQVIGGVNDGSGTIAVVFDLDYSDGVIRGDTTIAVYDASETLIYVGRESNIEDDQPTDPSGSIDDLSRGSIGKKDPFIGPVHLIPGQRYSVAVMSNLTLPAQINSSLLGASGNPLARLEPINSVTRVVEDHIGFQGYASGGTTIDPENTGGLFDISDTVSVGASVIPFTFQDVELFVSRATILHTVDPFAPNARTSTAGLSNVQDIVIRSDGRLFGYQPNGSTISAGTLVELDPGNLATTLSSQDDNIPGTLPTPDVSVGGNVEQFTTSANVDAVTFQRGSLLTPNYTTYYSVREFTDSSKLYRAGADGGNATVVGDIQPSGVTFATDLWDVSDNATPPATAEIRIESKIPGEQGNTISFAITRTDPTNGAVVGTINVAPGISIDLDIGGTGFAAGGPVTAAPTAQEIVDAINSSAASQYVTAVITGGNAGTQALNLAGVGGSLFGGSNDAANPTLGGRVTGLSYGNYLGNGPLYGVTDQGDFIAIDTDDGHVIRLLDVATALGVPNVSFQGLTLGPQNVDGSDYANTVFAVADDGTTYAFDTDLLAALPDDDGDSNTLQSLSSVQVINVMRVIFDSNNDGIADSNVGDIPVGGGTGLAFSPLDFSLWHPTTRRGTDTGHGINESPDQTRTPASELVDLGPATDVRAISQSDGGASYYFGFEQFNQFSPEYLQYDPAINAQFGITNTLVQRDLSSNPRIAGTYNLLSGASGSLTTNSFDLSSSDGSDRPTLYFNYFLDTEEHPGADNVSDPLDPFLDSARVFASRDGGATWELIATNNSRLSPADPTTENNGIPPEFLVGELPGFLSHLSDAGLNSSTPRDESHQIVQELFDSTGGWRQARVDLSTFAGEANLTLRVDFAAAGAIRDAALADVDPTLGGVGANFGDINSSNQFAENQFEGFYIDDILIGFAERGETVTGSSASNSFLTDLGSGRTQDNDPNKNPDILRGNYQLEIRRVDEHVLIQDDTFIVDQTFDTNFRHIEELSRSADRNRERPQGVFIIDSNFITDSSVRGINVAPGTLQANGGVSHPGSTINFPQLNTERLIPGIVIQNNVIAGPSGIRFAGEPVASSQRPVSFGRILNNTIVGDNQSGIGIEIVNLASPTLLNNLLTDLGTGIVDGGTGTVIRSNFFQNNGANGAAGSASLLATAGAPLFVDSNNRNYYLLPGSQAIDSSQNTEQDRFNFVTFKTELGLLPSPIVAPDRDVYGQLRVDSGASPGGGGSDVFKDRGAVDRSDTDAPYAVLLKPIDTNAAPEDRDPNDTVVHVSDELLESFTIFLGDGSGANSPFEGTGVNGLTVDDPNDSSISSRAVTILQHGRTLVEGVDYTLGYNDLTGVLLLTPLSTIWDPTAVYTILLNNTLIADRAGNRLRANQDDGTTKFTIVMPRAKIDFGDAAVDGTFLVDDGARHVIAPGDVPRLGQYIDHEPDSLAVGQDDDLAVLTLDGNVDDAGDGPFTITAAGSVSVTLDSLPVTGDNLSVTADATTIVFEFIEGGGPVVVGRVSVDYPIGSDLVTISDRLAEVMAAEMAAQNVQAVVTHVVGSTLLELTGQDDEDGALIGSVTFAGNQIDGVFIDPSTGEILSFLNPLSADGAELVIHTIAGGLLDAWVDFNGDGDFDDAGEQVLQNEVVIDGENRVVLQTPLSPAVSAATGAGITWARFRLSTLGNLTPDGLAVDGEVEDYQVLVAEVGIPVPSDDQYTFDEDTTFDLTGVGSVGDNDNKAGISQENYTVIDDVTHGTLVMDIGTGEFVYTPEADFYGTDTFTYRLSGVQPFPGGPGTIPVTSTQLGTVTLTVTPVNDAPFAVDQTFVTTEPSDTNVATTSVTVTKSQLLTGALPQEDAALRTTPWDELEQSLKIVQITVVDSSGVNQSLVALTDPTTPVDGTYTGDTYLDDGTGTFVKTGSVTVTVAGNEVTEVVYQGAADYNQYNPTAAGSVPSLDSFVFTIADDGKTTLPDGSLASPQPAGETSDATVSIQVRPQNDLPTAVDDTFTLQEDTTLTILQSVLLTNDFAGPNPGDDESLGTNGDDGALSLVTSTGTDPNFPLTTPQGGTVTVDTNGDLLYTPAADFYGDDRFDYFVVDQGIDVAVDGTITSNPKYALATVSLTVSPVNDAPSTTDKSFTTNEDTTLTITAGELYAGSVGDASTTATVPLDESNQTFQIVALDANGTSITTANAASGPFATPHGSIDNVAFDANGFLVDFVYTPILDFNSTDYPDVLGNPILDTFGFTVQDDGLAVDPAGGADIQTTPETVDGVATIFVTSINDDPLLDTPVDRTINEDDPQQTVSLTGIAPGGGEPQNVRITATSSDTTLFVDPVITYTNPETTGTLVFTPIADRYGMSIVTVTVEDAGLDNDFNTTADNLTVLETFTVTIDPVNDAPATTDKAFTTDEDMSLTITAINLLAGSIGDANPLTTLLQQDETNQAFQIVAIDASGTSITAANAASGPFATSHGSIDSVTFDTSGFLVDIVYTPILDFNSTDYPDALGNPILDTFGFTVQDDGLAVDPAGGTDIQTTQETVDGIAWITVVSINDAPLLDDLTDVTLNEDDSQQTVSLTGIAPGGGEPQDLRITATSSDPTLFADPIVTYSTPDVSGSISLTPIADRYGSAIVTVTVEDAGLDNDFNTAIDNLTVVKTFTVTIDPVNDTPATTDKAFTTDEDTSLTITAFNLFTGSTGDANRLTALLQQDETNQAFRVVALDANGISITTANAASGPFVTPHGSIDSVAFDGSGHLVDFVYTPALDFNSTDTAPSPGNPILDTFGFTVEDDGLAVDPTGGADTQTTPRSVDGVATVFVNSINDEPLLDDMADVTIREDDPLQTVLLTGIAPGGGEIQDLRVTASSNDTTLFADPVVTYSSPDTTGSIDFTPIADRYGTVVVSVRIEDGGLDNDLNTASDNRTLVKVFTVTVEPVNDAPSTVDKGFTTAEDTSLIIIADDLYAGSVGDASPLTTLLQQDETNQGFRIVALNANGTLVNLTNAASGPFATLHGSIDNVTFDANGHLVDFLYTPALDFNSTDTAPSPGNPILDTFGFTVEDDGLAIDPDGGSDIQTTPRTVDGVASVLVASINDAPLIDDLVDTTIREDDPLQTVTLTGIAPGGGEPQDVRITATNSDTTLFVDPVITYSSPDTTGMITFTPIADRYGTSIVTLTVEDAGLDNDFNTAADNLTVVKTFTVTIDPVNDAPATTDKAFTTDEDMSLTITAVNLLAGSTGDANPLTTLQQQNETNQAFRIIALDANGTSITAANAASGPFATPHGSIDNVTFDASGFLVDFVYTPTLDFNSTDFLNVFGNPILDTLGFTVEDDGLAVDPIGGSDIQTTPMSIDGTATIFVVAVGDNPLIDDLSDITINEDDPLQTLSLTGISAGGSEPQQLRISATSSDPTLFVDPTVLYASPSVGGSLSLTPIADRYGAATVSVTVEDAGLDNDFSTTVDNLSVVKTFIVTVNPVNDTPAVSDQFFTVAEDTARTISAADLTFSAAGDAVPATSLLQQDETNQSFRIVALDANGTSITSANVTTGPFATLWGEIDNVVFDANGHLIDFDYTPNPDFNSTDHPDALGNSILDSIGFTLEDDGLAIAPGGGADIPTTPIQVTAIATLFVVSVNDQPTLDTLGSVSLDEDTTLTVNLSGIGVGGGETQQVQVSITSDNVGLLGNPVLNFTSPDSTGSIDLTPLADRYGSATVTVTIEDSGLDNDFATTDDNLTTTQTFDVTVNPVNDAPATTNKSFTTSEETPLTISAADLFAGSLGDVAPLAPSPQDESNQSFRVVEFDADGVVVTASNASAAPFATPHGQIDNIRFNSSGHLVDFVYTPDADFSSINGGSPVLDLFGFTVEDDGLAVDPNIGPDIPTTPLNVAATARIFVTSINDAPTLDALANVSIDEDGPLQSVTLSGVSAGGSEVQPVRITATSGDVSLIPDPTITYTSGDATGLLGFTPSADRYGTTTITVTVEDAGVDNDFGTVADNLTVTQTFVVTVNPVNDAPSTTDKSFSANEDTALTISAGQLIAQSSGHTDPQGPLPYDESNQLFQVIAIDADGVSVTGVNASSAPFGLTNGEITAVNFDTNGYLVDLVYTPNADSNLSDVFAFTVQDDGLALDPNNGSSVSTPPPKRPCNGLHYGRCGQRCTDGERPCRYRHQ